MTVIRPNSISGITSLTAAADNIEFYNFDGDDYLSNRYMNNQKSEFLIDVQDGCFDLIDSDGNKSTYKSK